MAKQVRYLRQVTPHLEDKYGAERANAIMEKAMPNQRRIRNGKKERQWELPLTYYFDKNVKKTPRSY